MSNHLVNWLRKTKSQLITRLFGQAFYLLLNHRERTAQRQRLTLIQNPQATAGFFRIASSHPEVIKAASNLLRVLKLLEQAHAKALTGEADAETISSAIQLLEDSDVGSVLVHARRSQIRPA